MIIVLFGQPHCGKTTLARKMMGDQVHSIDGDELRALFKNKNYTREGRIQNLNRASVILSLIYPYKEARDYLNDLNENVKWIYLTYNGERGRENYHVKDFEVPGETEKVLRLNTTELSPEECIVLIERYLYAD